MSVRQPSRRVWLLALLTSACVRERPCATLARAAEPTRIAVEIPRGIYAVGCSDDASCTENPTRTVETRGFMIDRYEVLLRHYMKCVSAHRCPPLRRSSMLANDPLEVAGVSYASARAYCLWRSGRLPTPDEWEIAARGHSGAMYSWGSRWDPRRLNTMKSAKLTEHLGYDYYRACNGVDNDSPFGVSDMSGGAPEFVDTSSEVPEVRGAPVDDFSDPREYSVVHVGHAEFAGFRCVYPW